jgi:hypothetical protein
MSAEILGRIDCPLCGNPSATIHRQAGRRIALYYRCYQSEGSQTAVCGTIQCTGPKGQELMNKLMGVEAKGQLEPEKQPIRPKGQLEAAPPSVKNTFLTRFLAGDHEE